MKKIFTPLIVAACLSLGLNAQNNKVHKCYTEEHFAEMAAKNPELLKQRRAAEVETIADANHLASNTKVQVVPTFVIPVVFHVIHAGGAENISKAQIVDQIRSLNEDYNRLNADSVNTPAPFAAIAGRLKVEFRLATLDPNGNCTEGIVRIYNPTMSNGPANRDDVKAVSYWPNSKYFNVWVVKAITSGSSAGTILGYAQFPGLGANTTDGVVMRHDCTGSIGSAVNSPFGVRKGRTLTHEAGHWLNLRHIWGDANCGNDQVSDTPVHTTSNSGCPSFPKTNTCAGAGANGEMFTNYMDYVDDACMNVFSAGQVTRMTAALNSTTGSRKSLWQPANLIATGTDQPNMVGNCAPTPDFIASKYLVCTNANITFTDGSYNGVPTGWNWTFTGATQTTYTVQNPVVSYPTAGIYSVTLTSANAVGSKSVTKTNFITVVDGTPKLTGAMQEDIEGYTSGNVGNWNIVTNGSTNWDVATNASQGTGTKSFFFDNFNNSDAGDTNDIVSPSFAFTPGQTIGYIKFRVAGQRNVTASADKLQMQYSTDCGASWTLKYNKSGASLATVTTLNSATGFVPTSTQWRKDSVNITSLSNAGNILFRFRFYPDGTNGGNNLYLDNINIDMATGIVAQANAIFRELEVYPNPVKGENINVKLSIQDKADVTLKLYDVTGKLVAAQDYKQLSADTHQLSIKAKNYEAGLYFMECLVNGVKLTRKVIVE